MNMEVQATHFEVYNSCGEVAAKIEMFDAHAATISIDYCTNAEEWLKIAEAVHKALIQMNLEG
jgi:hypothetical protein